MVENYSLHIAIDASNIRQGGGITHLSQLLAAANPDHFGIGRVTVWASKSTALELPKRSWLKIRESEWVESILPFRIFSQQYLLPKEIENEGCDLLFSPGGTITTRLNIPVVTMSQNLLPFEPIEAARFGKFSPMRFKMWLLRYFQVRSFKQADGVIFLTQYALDSVSKWVRKINIKSKIISHGVEERFLLAPRKQRNLKECSLENTFKLLYVSILMPYKHQIEVAIAVSKLRLEGYPVSAKFIGNSWGSYGKKFQKFIKNLDPEGKYLIWPGSLEFNKLHKEYSLTDAFVFASSCENLPNILIEAMAAGLPIVSSDRGPMTEVLADGGIYFDPENTDSIAFAIKKLIDNSDLRQNLAELSWMRSKEYSWDKCATETFAYIAEVFQINKNRKKSNV